MKVDVEEGKEKYYCVCGESKNQPWCDGSHENTGFLPLRFTPTAANIGICQCRRSKNLPYCDGSHKSAEVQNPVM